MNLTYDPDIFDAVEFGDLETIKLYWQKNIDINFQEKGGNTMLMLAAYYGFEEIVEFLLSKQPDLDLRNDLGLTALDIAREKAYNRIAVMIEDQV